MNRTMIGGAVGLLSKDMDSPLRRWNVAGPEVCRLLEEYERLYIITSIKTKGNTRKTILNFIKLSSTTLKNYFSTLMKFANRSRGID